MMGYICPSILSAADFHSAASGLGRLNRGDRESEVLPRFPRADRRVGQPRVTNVPQRRRRLTHARETEGEHVVRERERFNTSVVLVRERPIDPPLIAFGVAGVL